MAYTASTMTVNSWAPGSRGDGRSRCGIPAEGAAGQTAYAAPRSAIDCSRSHPFGHRWEAAITAHVRQLSKEGQRLLIHRLNRGVFVRVLTVDDVIDLYRDSQLVGAYADHTPAGG